MTFNYSCQIAATYEYHEIPNKILGETEGVTNELEKWGNKNNYRFESIIFYHIVLYLWDNTTFEEYMYMYDTRNQV